MEVECNGMAWQGMTMAWKWHGMRWQGMEIQWSGNGMARIGLWDWVWGDPLSHCVL